MGAMMDNNATWARTNLPAAAGLSDTELHAISSDVWRAYRRVQMGVFGALLFIYLVYLDDRIALFFFDEPSFVHHLVVAMILGTVFGGLLGWFFQTMVRRRIRKVIDSR